MGLCVNIDQSSQFYNNIIFYTLRNYPHIFFTPFHTCGTTVHCGEHEVRLRSYIYINN